MPHTTYGVLSAIRSHQISSPKVSDQLATGRPNACNLCHLDKSLTWTAQQLAQWYGHELPKWAVQPTDVADSVRLAMSGDAGQRALLAWHFGWEPALRISGKAWVAPVLAQLLDDPYAAVRCVAERSARRVGAMIPSGYDYTIAPDARSPVRTPMVESWATNTAASRDPSFPPATLVRWKDPQGMQESFDQLTRERDDRPVRLRE
jgi:hypothetical protein